MKTVSPFRALVLGIAAGAIGAGVQTLFAKATSPITPETPKGAFDPPEFQQRSETATQTIARRVYEDLMERGPLSPAGKKSLAKVVHYEFGAAWGGLYGLLRESYPSLLGPIGSTLGFGTLVWVLSDDVLLPAFNVAGPPRAYPWQVHAYAIASHLVYGAAVYYAYEALRDKPLATAVAYLAARRRIARRLPAPIRSRLAPVVGSVAKSRARRPIDRLRDAILT
jgi:uncharacterized membrane protein YagU involved in acid resistance